MRPAQVIVEYCLKWPAPCAASAPLRYVHMRDEREVAFMVNRPYSPWCLLQRCARSPSPASSPLAQRACSDANGGGAS